MLSSVGSERIIRALAGLANELGLSIVAEGVERPEEIEALHALGCQFGQGFYYYRPVPDERVWKLLTSGTETAAFLP